MTQINSITLLGSSSGRNAGDAALISAIMDSVDAALGRRIRWEIPTIAPNFVTRTYKNDVVPISMLPWSLSVKMLGLPTWRSIMRTDLTLIFDAILFDRALFNPLFNFLSTLYLMLPAAVNAGKRFALYDCGAGPVNTPLGQKMLRELCDLAEFITIREEGSMKVLENIGVTNPNRVLTADAALNDIPSSPERAQQILAEVGLKGEKEILALNVSKYLDTWAGTGRESMGREAFLSGYAQAINATLERLNVPVLFVVTQHHDLSLTKELQARIRTDRKTALVDNIRYTHFDIKAVLGQVSLLFAMRLHAVILASSMNTPVLGLPHQPKVGFYLDTLGMPEQCLDFNNFSAENLQRALLSSWERRGELRQKLERVIPPLQHRAHIPAQIIAALDRSESASQFFTRKAA